MKSNPLLCFITCIFLFYFQTIFQIISVTAKTAIPPAKGDGSIEVPYEISSLPGGIYFLHIKDGNEAYMRKSITE